MTRVPEVHELFEPELIGVLSVLMGVEGGQEDLKVGEGLTHRLVERTHQRPELLHDLAGGRLREVGAAGLDAAANVGVQGPANKRLLSYRSSG